MPIFLEVLILLFQELGTLKDPVIVTEYGVTNTLWTFFAALSLGRASMASQRPWIARFPVAPCEAP